MKNKLLALLIFSVTILGLVFYFSEYFWVSKDEISGSLEEKQEKNNLKKEIKKQVFLEKKEEKLKKQDKIITNKQKIEKIREKTKHFKVIELWASKFYFDIIWKDLVLSLANTNKEIWVFSPILKKDIKIEKIYENPSKFFLSLLDKKYIFSKKYGVLASFDFKIPINYIKEDELYYIISSEKWVFLLDKKTKKLSYSHIFSDFVLYKKSYLAIINKTDKKRLDDYNINSKNKDVIFFYNPVSKEQKVVLKSSISLEKIYKIWKKVFFENGASEIFELKNF